MIVSEPASSAPSVDEGMAAPLSRRATVRAAPDRREGDQSDAGGGLATQAYESAIAARRGDRAR